MRNSNGTIPIKIFLIRMEESSQLSWAVVPKGVSNDKVVVGFIEFSNTVDND